MTERLAELGIENIKLPEGREFVGWLQEFSYFDQEAIEITGNFDDVFGLIIYTSIYSYKFRITSEYLGCQSGTRMPRAGEDWNRGSDLPDGKFAKETLIQILGAILFYESQKVVDLTVQSLVGPPVEEGGSSVEHTLGSF